MIGAKRFVALIVTIVFTALIVTIMAFLLTESPTAKPFMERASAITGADYETESGSGSITLPYSFQNLPPRTPVTVYMKIESGQKGSLLVKSVYAPLKLYADGVLIYESGQDGSYPAFLLDPPTIISTVLLPDGTEQLRFEYLSPTQRNTLIIFTPLIGSESTLITHMFKQNSFSVLFALLLLLIGVVMALTALFLKRNAPSTKSFLWLGLFCVAVGCWIFGENNFSVLILPHPSLLYMMAFIGLFTLPIPFLRFGILLLKPKNKLPIHAMLAVQSAAVIATLALQLAGIAAVSKTLFVFHALDLLSFVVFATCTFWEYARYKNAAAKPFALPALVFALFTLLEILNYRFRFTNVLSLFFQIGMLIFFVFLFIISYRFVHDATRAASEKALLEFEVSAMGKQLALQGEQYKILVDSAANERAMRHDFRHHLSVIKTFADSSDAGELNKYLSDYFGSLPLDNLDSYCQNSAVNAVVCYYINKAANIDVSVNIDIPKDINIPDTDLCVIFGNCLENAIEACQKLPIGEGFIKLKTRRNGRTLGITVDNSFDGEYTRENDMFISRKHEGCGIGLSSVAATAKKYNGTAMFEVVGREFRSSVLLVVPVGGECDGQ